MISESSKPRGLFANGRSAVQECGRIFKAGGFKAVIRRYGWKIFVVFFAYYLIRDLTIYILIPYLIADHFVL